MPANTDSVIFHDINQHLTSISDEDSAKFRFHSVTEEDVSKIIKNLPSNKAPVACFSKVPKLYGPFSGVTISFVSQEGRGFKSSNFTAIFLFVTLKSC